MGAWHKLNLSIFKKVLSVGSGKLATELNKKVDEINSKEQELEKFSDEEIKKLFQGLKQRLIDEDVYSLELLRTYDISIVSA